jgi:hypothetical protein
MHIGRHGKESKTECMFFLPCSIPQIIANKEAQHAIATTTITANMIDSTTSTNQSNTPTITTTTNSPINTPTDSPTETTSSTPNDFPIDSRINIINHPKLRRKHGIVKKHTNKYVTIKITGKPKTTRILPKFLQLHTNDTQTFIPIHECTSANRLLSIPKVIKKKKPDEPNPDQTEHEHLIYDNLTETQNFQAADGIVFFTGTFKYLGSRITYNLRDNEDVKARIAAANSSMDALKELWSNPNLNTYNKYLLFQAVPMNLLLWGCEIWSQRQSLLDKLEVFLHKCFSTVLPNA